MVKKGLGLSGKYLHILSLIVFIGIQWYSVYFMWYMHPGPLGINDGPIYCSEIEFCKTYPFFQHGTPTINRILYPYFYGMVAKFSGLSSDLVFYLNFYFGLTLMGIVLYNLFRRINSSSLYFISAFLFYAFYEGNGFYHGFFWVVTSFYAIMLFLLLFVVLFYSKHYLLYGIPLMVIMLLTHSTGIYLSAVLLFALLINAVFFNRSYQMIWWVVCLMAIVLIVFLVSEYLYSLGVVTMSFSASFMNYQKLSSYSGAFADGGLYQKLTYAFNELLTTVRHYHFVRYFMGVYTPLVVYSVFCLIKDRQYPLFSLFLAVFIGQICMSMLSNYSYRFFYPLEVVTIAVIAYGAANAIEGIVSYLINRNEAGQPVLNNLLIPLVMSLLSVLYLYEAVHLKVGHNYSFKMYNPRFLYERALLEYLDKSRDRKVVVFTIHPSMYTMFDGLYDKRNIFYYGFDNALGFDQAAIKQNPSGFIIVGENYRYFEGPRQGFMVAVPKNGALVLKTSALISGKYKIELVDTGLLSVNELRVEYDGLKKNVWKHEPYTVRYPEKNFYPPVLMPWYLHADKPWPLFPNAHNKNVVRRETVTHSLVFDVNEPVNEIVLKNSGNELALCGEIRIVGLNRPYRQVIDLDWGDADVLNSSLGIRYEGRSLPLLWVGGYPGMLMRMEENFKDVKAYSFYSLGWPVNK